MPKSNLLNRLQGQSSPVAPVGILISEWYFNIFQYGQLMNEVESLEDKANPGSTDQRQLNVGKGGYILVGKMISPGGWAIKFMYYYCVNFPGINCLEYLLDPRPAHIIRAVCFVTDNIYQVIVCEIGLESDFIILVI